LRTKGIRAARLLEGAWSSAGNLVKLLAGEAETVNPPTAWRLTAKYENALRRPLKSSWWRR
jgi:hypothetical protein